MAAAAAAIALILLSAPSSGENAEKHYREPPEPRKAPGEGSWRHRTRLEFALGEHFVAAFRAVGTTAGGFVRGGSAAARAVAERIRRLLRASTGFRGPEATSLRRFGQWIEIQLRRLARRARAEARLYVTAAEGFLRSRCAFLRRLHMWGRTASIWGRTSSPYGFVDFDIDTIFRPRECRIASPDYPGTHLLVRCRRRETAHVCIGHDIEDIPLEAEGKFWLGHRGWHFAQVDVEVDEAIRNGEACSSPFDPKGL